MLKLLSEESAAQYKLAEVSEAKRKANKEEMDWLIR